jgi:hypothetical protein
LDGGRAINALAGPNAVQPDERPGGPERADRAPSARLIA